MVDVSSSPICKNYSKPKKLVKVNSEDRRIKINVDVNLSINLQLTKKPGKTSNRVSKILSRYPNGQSKNNNKFVNPTVAMLGSSQLPIIK